MDRLSPFKDDKPKDTEISPFEAGLNWYRQAKLINDKLGHIEGDKTLKKCARALGEIFSDYGGEIYRIGGDEFAAILKDASEETIRNVIEDISLMEKMSFGFTISKGYALFSGKESVDEMFIKADRMLFKNKKLKREKLR